MLGETPRRVLLTKAGLLPGVLHAGAPRKFGMSDARIISAHTGEGIKTLLDALWRDLERDAAPDPPKDRARDQVP